MSFLNCNKNLNTFNMVAGLEFKLVLQNHEIVMFLLYIASITSSWKYDYIDINDRNHYFCILVAMQSSFCKIMLTNVRDKYCKYKWTVYVFFEPPPPHQQESSSE